MHPLEPMRAKTSGATTTKRVMTMARYVTTVQSRWDPETAFGFMADLRNFARWDPGVRTVQQVTGRGAGADSVFDVTVAAGPRDMTLRYRTVEFDAPTQMLAVARSSTLTSEDRITVEATASGCSVTYDADLRLSGVLRLADPILRLAFGRIGDRAAAGLREALEGDPPESS